MPEPTNKGQPDDPRRADESGEPGESGRSHGRVVDKENPDGTTPSGEAGTGDPNKVTERSEHWESGRQQA